MSTSLRFTRLALSASLRDRHETLPQWQQPLGMAAELANLKFESLRDCDLESDLPVTRTSPTQLLALSGQLQPLRMSQQRVRWL